MGGKEILIKLFTIMCNLEEFAKMFTKLVVYSIIKIILIVFLFCFVLYFETKFLCAKDLTLLELAL